MNTIALTAPGTTARGLQPAQRTAARLAGALYLGTMAAAVFVELSVRGRLFVSGDAAATARNIAASELLFRAGFVTDLLMYAAVAALVVALYVVLRPIDRNLALLAAVWRLVENAVLMVATLGLALAAVVLGGADYLSAFEPEQLQGLARLSLSFWGTGHRVGMVLLGLGSALFSYLWLRSRYIPRGLAAWGILSSLLLATVSALVLVLPSLGLALGMTYMAPMGIYEVGLGLWLLVKGIREPTAV